MSAWADVWDVLGYEGWCDDTLTFGGLARVRTVVARGVRRCRMPTSARIAVREPFSLALFVRTHHGSLHTIVTCHEGWVVNSSSYCAECLAAGSLRPLPTSGAHHYHPGRCGTRASGVASASPPALRPIIGHLD